MGVSLCFVVLGTIAQAGPSPTTQEFAPLPAAPGGWSLREVARMPIPPTRVASDGSGKFLLALGTNGDVWKLNPADGALKQLFEGAKYVSGEVSAFGMTLDKEGRLYVIANVRDASVKPNLNRVTIFRSSGKHESDPADLKPWLKTEYPYGVNNFNHGVGHIAQGPDGFLYVSSGSRTDANEASEDLNFSSEGETPLTACIWRLDPKSDKPTIEVFAHGLRNPYGFCWDDEGRLIATENGPNLDPPEELNEIKQGCHYGFPYQFSNWSRNPYKHIGPAPADLKMTPPILNVGPDGGVQKAGKPIGTFDAHSSPAGIVFLGDSFPEKDRRTFLVPRFGNMIEQVPDVGFDVLQVRLREATGDSREAEVKTFMKPVSRPVDIHISGGKVYLVEHARELGNFGASTNPPGRILELSPIK
ncbi:MAG: PQQ-dependent sugar dehydrogenase [Planctomycetota bacterium]|nr:PQQ-dependent sugar dehydrogenase [Planctomycetota bacterium]